MLVFDPLISFEVDSPIENPKRARTDHTLNPQPLKKLLSERKLNH
jgi:hypothetical protein